MRPDWLEIAQAITDAGMICGMTTGGFGISLTTARRMKETGIKSVSVSIYGGTPETHDRQHGKQGGNNPYCHHHALKQAEKGIRERFYPQVKAQGLPFDNGEFTLVEEPIGAPLPENDPLHFTSDRLKWSESWQEKAKSARMLTESNL